MSEGTEDYNASTVHQVVSEFERALKSGESIEVDSFLQGDGPFRWQLLVELVHADLEMRLRRGEDARLFAYLERYPELKNSAKDIDSLLQVEMKWRSSQGLPLDQAELERLYPEHLSLIRHQFILLGKMPQIPGFLWIEELGSGSFGVVYKALQTSMTRPVAIKVLKRNIQELSSQEIIRF